MSSSGDPFGVNDTLAAAFAFAAIVLAIFFAPLFLVAGVPVAAYIYHRNSPATKEKDARKRTEELYRIASEIKPSNWNEHLDRIIAAFDGQLVRDAAFEIYMMEGVHKPDPVPLICNSIEGARYRDKLLTYINSAHIAERVDDFVTALIDCMPKPKASEGIFEASERLSNKDIQRLILPFYDYEDHFRPLKKILDRNLAEQKGVFPEDYKGDNCAFAYLKDTPLLELEKRSFKVGLKARTEHTQIVAGTGSGKTSLLHYLIHHDLWRGDCCVILIDSQKQLIKELTHRGTLWTGDLAWFSPHHNLGINLFDVKAEGEAEAIAIIDLMEYVLEGLLDAKLTGMQSGLFGFVTQLMVETKGNLTTLKNLLKKDGLQPHLEAVTRLPPPARDFFLTEFNNKNYEGTKEQIRWRIDALQKNPAFARIFDAPTNPIDMADEMANRNLILIDTDVDYLGEAGSAFFGRLFVALILKAARQRFEGRHRPVYLYVDESNAYFDERLELMLQQARKANIGVILAHQDLDQARKANILSAILGNTATKFTGRLNDADARTMAANMRTTPELLKSVPRYHFALSQVEEPTCIVTANTREVERIDRRTSNAHFKEEMEERYGYAPLKDEPKVPPSPPLPIVDEEVTPSSRL